MTSNPEDGFPARDAGSDVGRITYEWGDGKRPSIAVVEAVSATTGREPTELSPLYEYLDGEALDTLLQSGSAHRNGVAEVSFFYEGVGVSVGSDGHIDIDPDADPR